VTFVALACIAAVIVLLAFYAVRPR